MSQKQRFFMMMAICLGAFLSHFTAGIVNVSLPVFTHIFQTELAMVQWITTGYLLVIATLLPVMGKLGDQYGHRLLHNYGFLLFTVSSVLVAFSTTITMLLALRVVQAIGAAMFQATNIALITILLPKEVRGRAMGIMGTAVALGGMTGPIAGGVIASWFSWEWLFLIHVPVAIVATGMAFRYIPSYRHQKKESSRDGVGAGLFMLLVSAVIWAISNGGWGWASGKMLVLYGVILVCAWVLIWWERRQSAPFLPLPVFRIMAVSSGLFVSFLSFVLANLVLVVLPFFLLEHAQLSPLAAGYMMTAYPLLLALTGPVSGWASDRYQARPLILAGLSVMGVGITVWAIWLGEMSTYLIIAVLAAVGAGMGLIASPNNSYTMRHVPLEYTGTIGGMIALTRNAGMVVGAALGLSMMNGEPGHALQPTLDSYRAVFGTGALICLVGLLVLWYVARVERANKQTVEVERA